MKRPLSPRQLSGILAFGVAIILVLLPFQALINTWPGSNFGHLDLFRIWKEILIFLISLPVLYLALINPSLRNWLKKSWLARLIGIYFVLTLTVGTWAYSAGR